MSSSIFAAVEMAPRDPILGLNEAFNADSRSTKVNLGVGVYFDDNGKIPLLGAVRSAEKTRLEAAPPRGYQPIEGPVAYNSAVQNLLFGADSAIIRDGRVVTAQALGGTGGSAPDPGTMALLLIPLSLVADRWGRERLMRFGLLGAALCALASAWAPDFSLLVLARGLLGACIAGVPAAAMAHLGEEVALHSLAALVYWAHFWWARHLPKDWHKP